MGNCPSNRIEAAHMKMRQRQRLGCSSRAQDWAETFLLKSGLKWKRERIWRWRLYDFWNSDLGCAVEIDGPEHVPESDRERDQSDFERSGIIVLRVRNFHEEDMQEALSQIKLMESWIDRRERMGLLTKAERARKGGL